MTWRTQIGERIIVGRESELLREAIGTMKDEFEQELEGYTDPWEFDVPLFDELEPLVKLALLRDVGSALLRQTDCCPPLTAINEATIGAMFSHIRQSVEVEIDCQEDIKEVGGDPFFWRRRILNVFHELNDIDDLPSLDSRDIDEWDIPIVVLTERILWDEDFNDADIYMDLPPEHGELVKRQLSIPAGYFTAIPPNPVEADLPEIRETLREICRS